MNQHINPPDGVKELSTIPAGTITAKGVERFFLIRGKHSSWIDGDVMTRAEIIQIVNDDAYEDVRAVLALSDITAAQGTWRNATDEIAGIVIERWAQDDVELTEKQREFVAAFKGEAFANSFRAEAA